MAPSSHPRRTVGHKASGGGGRRNVYIDFNTIDDVSIDTDEQNIDYQSTAGREN
jgi:hypothetical protein